MIAAGIVVVATLAAVAIAAWSAAPAARWRARTVRPRVLVRALFPNRIVRSASGRLDIGFMLFAVLLASSALGWALVSSGYFAAATQAALGRALPAPAATQLPGWLCAAIMTVALYLAYELAYWLNHYVSHRIPLLWEFHKVHHSAESLSPLTNFRVHPVDTILFYNMAAAITGAAAGALDFAFGRSVDPVSLGGTSALVFLSSALLTHLQHTHLWISFPGRWGRLLLSPAHHQIHHSIDSRHHDRNYGSTCALFDHLFGTLYVPAKRRERLRFGLAGLGYDPHGASGALLLPFAEAARHLRREPANRSIAPRPSLLRHAELVSASVRATPET